MFYKVLSYFNHITFSSTGPRIESDSKIDSEYNADFER